MHSKIESGLHRTNFGDGRNRAEHHYRLILSYLVPCHLLTTHTLPTTNLLALHPRLEALFRPLCSCIKRGDLSGFDAALASGEHELVKRRIYLTLERGRDIALRNLFRLVFLAGGFEETKDGQAPVRRTRVPVTEFAAAMQLGTKTDSDVRVDIDEVECFLANLIYKVNFLLMWCVSLNYQAAFLVTLRIRNIFADTCM
jgi:COP9 signalosome complex subunit 12